MAKQYEAAKLDEAKQAAIIQVVDPAVDTDKKSSPKRLLIGIVGLLVGFLSAVFYSVFQEAIQRISRNPEHADRIQALRRALFGRPISA